MKYKKAAEWIIKFLILSGSCLLVYFQIKNSENKDEILPALQRGIENNLHLIILLFILVFVNWGIEAFKWKFLAIKLEKISYFKAFRSVMSGVTIGMFTPNRIGEFAGRVLYLRKENRAEGSVLSLTGSFAQFFTTLFMGIPALIFYILMFSPNKFVESNLILPIILSVLSAIILMIVFFNLQWIYHILIRIPFLEKQREKFKYLKIAAKKDLFHLLILSIFRYFVFILQFYLICRVFMLEISFLQVLTGSANVYFLMSMLPVFTLGEPALRASLTGIFFSVFTLNISGIISASVLLWIINVLFVALTGAILLLNQKIFKYESSVKK